MAFRYLDSHDIDCVQELAPDLVRHEGDGDSCSVACQDACYLDGLRGALTIALRNVLDHAVGTGSDIGGSDILGAHREDQNDGDTVPEVAHQPFLVGTVALELQNAQTQIVVAVGSAVDSLACCLGGSYLRATSC